MPGLEPGIHVFASPYAGKSWMVRTSPAMTMRRSIGFSLVRDHLAVVRKASGRQEFDRRLELRHGLEGGGHGGPQVLAARAGFGGERHHIRFAVAGDDEAELAKLGMAPPDL